MKDHLSGEPVQEGRKRMQKRKKPRKGAILDEALAVAWAQRVEIDRKVYFATGHRLRVCACVCWCACVLVTWRDFPWHPGFLCVWVRWPNMASASLQQQNGSWEWGTKLGKGSEGFWVGLQEQSCFPSETRYQTQFSELEGPLCRFFKNMSTVVAIPSFKKWSLVLPCIWRKGHSAPQTFHSQARKYWFGQTVHSG